MAKLVVLITSRVDEGHSIGEAWQKAGAPGVTFVESYGLRRVQEASGGEILPGILSIAKILRDTDQTSLIVLSVLEDPALPEKLIQATNNVLGDLTRPETGVLFVLDVERAVGIRNHSQSDG